MDWEEIVTIAVCGSIALVCFAIAYRQHRQKGFVATNRWLWASKEDREDMDARIKQADYLLGRNAFFFMGIIQLAVAASVFAPLSLNLYMRLILLVYIVYVVVHDIKNAKLYHSILEEKM